MPRPASPQRQFVRLAVFITSLLPYFIASFCLASCSHSSHNDPSSLTFVIKSSPTNLDPRFATDSQSQRIDGLLFNGLLQRDNQMNFHGDLAESWDTPNPLTYVSRLRHGVHFHDGRALTDQIRVEMNQEKRKVLCSEVQKILAEDLPYVPLWFNDVVSVHRRSLGPLDFSSTADYNFLSSLRPSGQ